MGPYSTIANSESCYLVERLITSAPMMQFITKKSGYVVTKQITPFDIDSMY